MENIFIKVKGIALVDKNPQNIWSDASKKGPDAFLAEYSQKHVVYVCLIVLSHCHSRPHIFDGVDTERGNRPGNGPRKEGMVFIVSVVLVRVEEMLHFVHELVVEGELDRGVGKNSGDIQTVPLPQLFRPCGLHYIQSL